MEVLSMVSISFLGIPKNMDNLGVPPGNLHMAYMGVLSHP